MGPWRMCSLKEKDTLYFGMLWLLYFKRGSETSNENFQTSQRLTK